MDNWEKAKSDGCKKNQYTKDPVEGMAFYQGADFGRAYSQGEFDEFQAKYEKALKALKKSIDRSCNSCNAEKLARQVLKELDVM